MVLNFSQTQALEASQGAVEHMRQRNFQLHCEVEKLRLRESELIQQIEQVPDPVSIFLVAVNVKSVRMIKKKKR